MHSYRNFSTTLKTTESQKIYPKNMVLLDHISTLNSSQKNPAPPLKVWIEKGENSLEDYGTEKGQK